MTMFLDGIDHGKDRIQWVRAGHEPAIFYDPNVDSFSSLDKGGGLPLDQPLQNIELAIGVVLS